VTSNDSADRLALNRGLPTTAADVAALRRLGAPRPIDLEAYLRFLQAIGDVPADLLRTRRGPKGPPFELRPRE
jgi:hypothetical protein